VVGININTKLVPRLEPKVKTEVYLHIYPFRKLMTEIKRPLILISISIFFILTLIVLLRFKPSSPQLPPDTTETREETQKLEPNTYNLIDESDDSLVANFPSIPQYPTAKVTESKEYTEEGGIGYSSRSHTNDSLSKIFNWYKQGLPKGGWEIVYSTKFDGESDTFLLEAEKRGSDEKEDILLSITGVKTVDDVKIIVTHHKGMDEYGATD
jgi:hypothetical protein